MRYFLIIIFLLRSFNSFSQEQEKKWHSELSFIYGVRILDPFLSDSSFLRTVGIMPAIGLNLYFPKKKFGIEAKRDLWVQLTGGNPNGFDINNYYEVNNLKIFYDGFKKIPLRFGVAHTWTRIDDFQKLLNETVHYTYQNKGISVDVSYFFWKTRVDYRTILYYNQPQIFHGTSFSLGLTFYFNPLKKK